MALGDSIFRSRAASLLRSSTPTGGHGSPLDVFREKDSKSPAEPPMSEKPLQHASRAELERSETRSSADRADRLSGQNAVVHDRDAQRVVRTIPTWVRTIDEIDEDFVTDPPFQTSIPPKIQAAQHEHFSVRFTPRSSRDPYRNPDHRRDSAVPLHNGRIAESQSRWKAFADASAYPAISAEGSEIVTPEWLARHGADYSRPWLGDLRENGDPEKGSARIHLYKAKRRVWYVRAQRTVLRSPIVPMVLRMIVWVFSATALGLAASVHHLVNDPNNSAKQTASTNMAIVVDVVAMVYLLYITYDEYSGKPLGLRPAKAKMRLIFLDLFFIVFDSANLSLAFQTLSDPICTASLHDPSGICARQKGLASVLLIALIAWLLTFSISVMRLIERVTGR